MKTEPDTGRRFPLLNFFLRYVWTVPAPSLRARLLASTALPAIRFPGSM